MTDEELEAMFRKRGIDNSPYFILADSKISLHVLYFAGGWGYCILPVGTLSETGDAVITGRRGWNWTAYDAMREGLKALEGVA